MGLKRDKTGKSETRRGPLLALPILCALLEVELLAS
jgi:hypothetical protein